MPKRLALITGITGQDGSYLAKFLLNKGYQVVGTYRSSNSSTHWRLRELGVYEHPNLVLAEFDLGDLSAGIRLIARHQPDEIYNFAAQTHVGLSFEQPLMTSDATAIGVISLLEAVRIANPEIAFFQAASAEVFGGAKVAPQNETTPFSPRSPYGAAKAFAYWAAVNYRDAYGIPVRVGIMFNHESPLRGEAFVTRKITKGIADLVTGGRKPLQLGNLEARRDWGFAGEYVKGIWMAMQRNPPDDYVFASGESRSVREFATLAFAAAGLELEWSGTGDNERARSVKDGRELIRMDPRYYRPVDVDFLLGDASKAHNLLGWRPKIKVDQLCEMMVQADIMRSSVRAADWEMPATPAEHDVSKVS